MAKLKFPIRRHVPLLIGVWKIMPPSHRTRVLSILGFQAMQHENGPSQKISKVTIVGVGRNLKQHL
ncbi:hypothetical protein EPI10_006772 [Gossypium australe]|uniref:Uncharacterized protein n=1 Tax=Gossypium australe TaxID=47621 RepID=A0A5B6WTA3_9ROSI|nr:hypothetical protein EPI10_006772 [Gossypium australe]